MSIKPTKKDADLHPCPYCNTLCFGKQCKNCHNKMIADKSADCYDCGEQFFALRHDGKKNKRCKKCKVKYDEEHQGRCVECNEIFNSVLEDGRIFDKCLDCYKKGFKKCEKCDKSINSTFDLCRDCYQEQKQQYQENKKKSPIEEERVLKDCQTKGCLNKTSSSLCPKCFESYNQLADEYMVSTCVKCGYRSHGYFKFCGKCQI